MYEHVVQEQHLVVEEANFELLGWRLSDLFPVSTQVSADPRAASGDVLFAVLLEWGLGVNAATVFMPSTSRLRLEWKAR
jgi:hypothetical protein